VGVAAGDDGTLVPTVTLLTCDSSKPLAWLHDRMPVILGTPEQLEAWLGVPLPPGHDAHTLFGAAAHHPGSPAAQEVHTPKASSKGMEQEDVKQEEGQESEEGIKAGSPGRAVKKEEQSGRDVSPKAAGQLEQDVATAEKGEEDQKPSHEYAAAGSGHGKGMGEEEEEHSATPGSSAKPAGGGDWSTFVAKVRFYENWPAIWTAGNSTCTGIAPAVDANPWLTTKYPASPGFQSASGYLASKVHPHSLPGL
jgi:hypothetical protein